MLGKESVLLISDTSGIRRVKIIGCLGPKLDGYTVGDVVAVSVVDTKANNLLHPKGSVRHALIISTKYCSYNHGAVKSVRTFGNRAIIIDIKKGELFTPLANISGPVAAHAIETARAFARRHKKQVDVGGVQSLYEK